MIFLFAVTACATTPGTPPGGDDDSPTTYPTKGGDSTLHMPTDPTPLPACDYTEQDDATNDYLANSGYMLEETGMTFAGTQKTICGTINSGHFDDYQYSVDVDNYGISLESDGDVIVTLSGAAQAISSVGIYAYNDQTNNTDGGSYFNGDHGVFSAHLAAGHYEFSMEAYDNQDSTADIAYKIQIKTDQPAQRCARVTALATYTEANDAGNNVVDVNYAASPRRSLDGTSTSPETAMQQMQGGSSYRIHGNADNVPQVGSYFDRDTYQITTGAMTDQISVRLNWDSQQADMDYYLFPAGNPQVAFGAEAQAQLGEDEFGTFPVAPNTTYWLWVGESASDSTAQTHYDASICAETFVQP